MRSGVTRTLEPSIGVNAFSRVVLVELTGTPLDSAYVNSHGDYILPLVPTNRMSRVEARLESARAARTMVVEFLSSPAPHRVDLTFVNYAPRFRDFLAARGGKRIRTATPGATIALTAQANDADGDPVSYRWQVPQGGGTLSSATGSNITWTLPAKPRRIAHRQRDPDHHEMGDGRRATMTSRATSKREPGLPVLKRS